MPISLPDGLTCFRWWCRFRDKTAENSERTASATLFFVRQTVGGPGFPRGYGMPMADNLAGKTAKTTRTRVVPPKSETRPAGFAHLMNASEHGLGVGPRAGPRRIPATARAAVSRHNRSGRLDRAAPPDSERLEPDR